MRTGNVPIHRNEHDDAEDDQAYADYRELFHCTNPWQTIVFVVLSKRKVVSAHHLRDLGDRIPAATGGVAERSKALVLKTSEGNTSQGSNPCPSAKLHSTSVH
jgi:hypothetical protein